MKNILRICAGMILVVGLWSVALRAGVTQAEFEAFVAEYEAQVIPLSMASATASYDASISGDPADYEESDELSLAYRKYHSDPAIFARLKAFREGGQITDPLLKRQLDILYLTFLGHQIDPAMLEQITGLETSIEQKFNTFRVTVGERTLSDNEVDSILRASIDSGELETVWKASKQIGRAVEADVRQVARLRNQAAKSIGFSDFYTMQLTLAEIQPEELDALFAELDSLTRDAYAELKHEIDSALAARFGITPSDLRPWHYQNRFFQEAPSIYGVDLDAFYAGRDPVEIARAYFAGIGMPIDTILAHSDLYEKPGKYQHAYSTDIDRAGDARIVCSVRPNYYWMNTLLHELGHATYSRYGDPELPWLLRQEAHSITTEAVAEFFGSLAATPSWLVEVVGADPAEVDKVADECNRFLRAEMLIFSRFSQVMVNFERELSRDPEQDLNDLWWDLVERYQLLPRPEGRYEPDWASKIHIASYPANYHSYLMGYLLSAQFTHALGQGVLGAEDPFALSFANDPRVGKYFLEQVYRPGSRYPWDEFVEKATGHRLSSALYARQFVHQK